VSFASLSRSASVLRFRFWSSPYLVLIINKLFPPYRPQIQRKLVISRSCCYGWYLQLDFDNFKPISDFIPN
jgi:hypothetical protein